MDRDIDQDFLIMIEPDDCERFQMPEGILLVGRNDPFCAMGFWEVLPGKRTVPRTMPIDGQFRTMAGTAVIAIQGKDHSLPTGQALQVPAKATFTVQNQGGDCVVFWKYDGDVEPLVEGMKQQYPRLPPLAREKSGYKSMFEEHAKRLAEKQGDY